jgi:hypothetical protein
MSAKTMAGRFLAPQPSPALLFTCRISRDVALLNYVSIRAREGRLVKYNNRTRSRQTREERKPDILYINTKTDVVHLTSTTRALEVVSVFEERGVNIRNLGYCRRYLPCQSLIPAIRKCTGLEKLQIGVGDERLYEVPTKFQDGIGGWEGFWSIKATCGSSNSDHF